jgi:hypothetical protein
MKLTLQSGPGSQDDITVYSATVIISYSLVLVALETL